MSQTGTIGIVGGGQLARMLTEPALKLGFKVVVLNPSPNSPASQVGAEEIIGDLYDEKSLRKLASEVDYITVEIEHLNVDVLRDLAKQGMPINPSPDTIGMIQDKFAQKQFLAAAGIPLANFAEITDLPSAEQALRNFGGKMLIKTRHGAYDGRGNQVVSSSAELKTALDNFEGQQLYAEKFVPFVKEVAIMIARGQDGQIVSYPVTETIHQRNICIETQTPAAITDGQRERAEAVALQVAEHLQGAGVFGIEMFLTADGQIIVNEIAPRVHNSGHYTIEACQTSQFEQNIRAITGMPLGPTDLIVPAAAMVNILGKHDGPTEVTGIDKAEQEPHTKVHIYGKSPTKIDRKMGHITSTGDNLEEARNRAEQAEKLISI
jgi:5-(carboxyamino)imidazole ribonucleotide synthase